MLISYRLRDMASVKTPRGRLRYKPANLFLGVKQIDRDVAFGNLKDLMGIMEQHRILATPAFGTLLGIIRENNFIEWDEDIDIFILEEDKDKLLDSFWDLERIGFKLVREDRCGLLYSIMRNGEYVDFYIAEKMSPEVRGSCDEFVLESRLTDLIDWDFRGLTVKIPRQYEEALTLRYGDWRTPVQYADFSISRAKVFLFKLKNMFKGAIPFNIKRRLLKKYHRKDFDAFLERCRQNGITFKYPIVY